MPASCSDQYSIWARLRRDGYSSVARTGVLQLAHADGDLLIHNHGPLAAERAEQSFAPGGGLTIRLENRLTADRGGIGLFQLQIEFDVAFIRFEDTRVGREITIGLGAQGVTRIGKSECVAETSIVRFLIISRIRQPGDRLGVVKPDSPRDTKAFDRLAGGVVGHLQSHDAPEIAA